MASWHNLHNGSTRFPDFQERGSPTSSLSLFSGNQIFLLSFCHANQSVDIYVCIAYAKNANQVVIVPSSGNPKLLLP